MLPLLKRLTPFYFFSAVLFSVLTSASAATPALRPEVEAFIGEMSLKYGYDATAARELLGQARFRASIVRAISTPGTARPWFEFRRRVVDAARIEAGVRFWSENAAALERASRDFGVPEEIIVATIG